MKTKLCLMLCIGAFSACGGNGNQNQDLGGGEPADMVVPDAAQACPPNTKQCVNDGLARVCPADGSGWLAVQCQAGDICKMGECGPDLNGACIPGDGICINNTTALRCNANGMGYAQVTCPASTSCVGNGFCQGKCLIGDSFCIGTGSVSTCADGITYTTRACDSGQLCVDVATGPPAVAACKPADCTPGTANCDLVCGNKAASASSTDPGYLSFCNATPNGYKWASIQCPTITTCDPAGRSCMGGGTQAACSSECTPGATRCTGNFGIQTCGTNGKWGTATNCNPAGGEVQVCVQISSTSAVCGDLVCNFGTGTCDAMGAFHACVNGKVSATGNACTMGLCVPTPSPGGPLPGSYQPGSCQPQCTNGDSRCVGPAGTVSFQTCANGVWGAATNCAAGSCQQFAKPGGGTSTVCGVCVPGRHRCTNPQGNQDGGNNTVDIELCDATGQFGAPTACTVGRCTAIPGDALCIADCLPNSTLCGGAPATGAGLTIAGTDTEATCTAQGLFPMAGATCTGGKTCRLDSAGNALGCVTCVGAVANENGLRDTRCTTAGGATSGTLNSIETCSNTNTWGSPAACPGTNLCKPATAGPVATPLGPYCHNCFGSECTESNQTPFGDTCVSLGFGAPMSCPSTASGSVPDCCSTFCRTDPAPVPSSCGP